MPFLPILTLASGIGQAVATPAKPVDAGEPTIIELVAAPAQPPVPTKLKLVGGGSIAQIFSSDDYPADALKAQETGVSVVEMTISNEGQVSACTVMSTSGSSSLDSATCRIIADRARFKPGLDKRGQPIEVKDTARVRWELPRTPFKSSGDIVQVLIEKDAATVKCLASQDNDCGESEELARCFLDLWKAQGGPLAIQVLVAFDTQANPLQRHSFDPYSFGPEALVDVEIGPDGRIVRCVERGGVQLTGKSACESVNYPLFDRAPTGTVRRGTWRTAVKYQWRNRGALPINGPPAIDLNDPTGRAGAQ